MIAKHGLYAYGIVGKSQAELGKSPKQLDILGIDQKNRVYPVEKGDICVMVSKIDTDKFQDEVKKLLSELVTNLPTGRQADGSNLSRTDGILRAHEAVVDALAKLTAVVPFKFGTILKDEEAASKMLQVYKEKFEKLLAKFTGKVEWGLKVYADNKKFKDYIGKNEPEFLKQQLNLFKVSSKGAAYLLGRKIEEEIDEEITCRLSEIAEIIFKQAERLVFEARRSKTLPRKLTGKEKEMILNCAYLIEKEKVGSFHKQIKTLTEKYQPRGVDLEISGPWPPYNFVSDENEKNTN